VSALTAGADLIPPLSGAQTPALTSQFYFCALPLRLDSYSHCRFNCLYCFAKARGGNRQASRLRALDPQVLARRLDRVYSGELNSAVDHLLARGQPIHIGGMSDPFMEAEEESRFTMAALEVLASFQHPAIISTKGTLYAREDYLAVIARGSFLIQASISSLDEDLLAQTDLGAPSPAERLKALRQAADAGIATSCRIQPVLPGREAHVFEVIAAARDASARQVSVEHLKLPIESSWPGTDHLSEALGMDLRSHFEKLGATRVGREWILPLAGRISRILAYRDAAHRLGLRFGAADTDLLLLSDGACCCSGADLIAGFERYHRYTYTEAARRGIAANEILLDSIAPERPPGKSIGQFVNSRSRLLGGAGIDAYTRANWNGQANGPSPAALAGIIASDRRDRDGNLIYFFEPWMHKLLTRKTAQSSGPRGS
jgi:DNA repair photolyase